MRCFDIRHLPSPGASRRTINYYGRFYRRELIQTLKRINEYLMRWAMRKYKRLRAPSQRATAGSWRRSPNGSRGLFAHWGWRRAHGWMTRAR